MKKTLIFDLDGTLIDTAKIVLPSFIQTIRHFPHVSMPSEKMMLSTFGMSDSKIWCLLMPNATEEEREQAHGMSEEFIREGLMRANVLLPNAYEVLETLSKRDYTLTIASNCGITYLNTILDSQGIRPFFDRPLCLESVHGQRKADILEAHFLHFKKEGAYMIGDRSSDIEAAHAHDIPAIGCDFGFGSEKELSGAERVIKALPELLDIFA